MIEMAKRGGGEALLAYVEANPIFTKLDPETIVYLNDLGVPENVVAAIIRKADADQPQPAPAENCHTGCTGRQHTAPPAQTQPAPPPPHRLRTTIIFIGHSPHTATGFMTADTAGSGGQPCHCGHRLAAVLPRRALDLQRCRLVLAFHIQLGMGTLPPFSAGIARHPRLVLGTVTAGVLPGFTGVRPIFTAAGHRCPRVAITSPA